MDGSSRHCIAYVTPLGACAASASFLPFTLFPRPPRAKRSPSPLRRPAAEPARLSTAPRPPRCACPAFLCPTPSPAPHCPPFPLSHASWAQSTALPVVGFLHLGAFHTLVVPPRQFGTCCPLVSPSPAPLSPLVPSHPLHLLRSTHPALPRLRSRAGSVPVPPLRRVAYLPPPSHGHSALSLKKSASHTLVTYLLVAYRFIPLFYVAAPVDRNHWCGQCQFPSPGD
ncbi:hypothetical protein B0H11DRAFT_2319479 [Mycena galericulata]|nr:hypothetical protein B0H11DRAFT_2319479 [Mycena galericulata]